MKSISCILFSIVLLLSCTATRPVTPGQNAHVLKPEKNKDGEWELVVMDDRFDYFMAAVAKSENFYEESYLKSRNRLLVSEWNGLYYSGRYRGIIDSAIDYDPLENYGKAFEYKLYQVFAYIQWRYNLRLAGLSAGEVR